MPNRTGVAVHLPRRLIWIAAPLVIILSSVLLMPLLLHTVPAHAGRTNVANPSSTYPGTWAKGADLPYAIGSLTLGLLDLTLLPNGKVLGTIHGGLSQVTTDTPLLYDPSSDTWSATSSLGKSIGGQTVTDLPNGKVLLAGGYTYCPADFQACATTIAKLYDPSTDTWSIVPPMPHPHADHAAVLLANGKVAIIGGDDSAISEPRPIASVDVYNPATNSWESAHDLPTPRFAHTALRLNDGRVLIFAGSVPAGSPTAYAGCGASGCTPARVDSQSSAYLADALTPQHSRMPFCGVNGCALATKTAAIYNPASNSWSSAASLPELLFDYTATMLPTGKALITGGVTAYPQGGLTPPLNTTLLYDPAHDAWSPGPSMQVSRKGHTATLLATGQVLIAGGFGSQQPGGASADLGTTEVYDPAANSWLSGPSMIHTHSYAGATRLANGQVFVAGLSLSLTTTSAAHLHGSVGSAHPASQVAPRGSAGPKPGTDIFSTVPGRPENVHATAGSGVSTISWSAPLSGGSAITGYTVTSSPGNVSKTVSGSITSVTLTGLASGTHYTFAVSATNALGTGPASAPSNSVTPGSPPTPTTAPAGGSPSDSSTPTPTSVPTDTPTTEPTATTTPAPTATIATPTPAPSTTSSPYLLIGGSILALLVLLGIVGAIIVSRRAQRS